VGFLFRATLIREELSSRDNSKCALKPFHTNRNNWTAVIGGFFMPDITQKTISNWMAISQLEGSKKQKAHDRKS